MKTDPMEAANWVSDTGFQYKCVLCQWLTAPVAPSGTIADAADDICEHMETAHAGVQMPTTGVRRSPD